MCWESAGKRQEECDEDHRQTDDREQDMWREQNPEVDEACRGICLGEEHVAVQNMIGDIGDEEDARNDEGTEHAISMCGDLTATDVTISDDEEDGAQGVEDRVERWEKSQMSAGDVDRRMIVDQPCEEE